MGILTHLHSAHSQVLLEWRAKGTGIGTEGQSSAASHWYINVCLPPRPLSALQPLAFWHWNFTHRGKNQKLLHAFSSKEKKNSRGCLTWDQLNWMLIQLNFQWEFYMLQMLQLSSLPLHHPSSSQACAVGTAWPPWGQEPHQAEILGSCSVCAPAFELHLCREPNIGNACAALEWTSLYHLWFQTSLTFAREIQI